MRVFLAILLFFAAAVGTWIVVLVGYGIISELIGFHDFEGATAMGVAFTIAPILAVIAATIASIWFLRRPQQG